MDASSNDLSCVMYLTDGLSTQFWRTFWPAIDTNALTVDEHVNLYDWPKSGKIDDYDNIWYSKQVVCGEMAIFRSRAIHFGPANNTKKVRLVLFATFRRKGAKSNADDDDAPVFEWTLNEQLHGTKSQQHIRALIANQHFNPADHEAEPKRSELLKLIKET
jgi:hypothetical protein